jgi:hypothetical protein
LDDVPSLIFDNKVHVLAELIKNSESAASAGPVVMIDADFTTVDGQLALSLPNFGTFDAYALTLTAIAPAIPGDIDHNGVVDAADYVQLRRSSNYETAYSQWRSNFGQTQASSTAVPEPSTLFCCVITSLLLAFRFRRNRPVGLA